MHDLRLERLTIALRPRTPWEAVDLGVALVRRHAAGIWLPWIAATLPVVIVASAVGHALGAVWIGGLLVWWAKPAFDRIPLYVLSRAVFGAAPDARETLRAQRRWGWRAMLAWLTWRRLHPGRAMLLPVDLLEQPERARRPQRVRVLSRASGSHNIMLTMLCVNIEVMLTLSLLTLGLMFVPIEFLSDSARALWDTLFDDPPPWAQFVLNLIAWLAMSLIEPFYVGAGFGLYLNRRTELEAWDIELAFRRLLARLSPALGTLALCVVLVLACGSGSTLAADGDKPAKATSAGEKTTEAIPTLGTLFAADYRAGSEAFESAVAKAYADPDLNPRRTIYAWVPRDAGDSEVGGNTPRWLDAIRVALAVLAKSFLWILAVIALAVVIRYHKRWLQWANERLRGEPEPAPALLRDVAAPEPVPDDPREAVRALWRAARTREALALLYRSAVRRLAAALDRPLPVGATEAECLRCARQLHADRARALFVEIVGHWQAAAYADRPPGDDAVEAMLAAWPAAWSPAP